MKPVSEKFQGQKISELSLNILAERKRGRRCPSLAVWTQHTLASEYITSSSIIKTLQMIILEYRSSTRELPKALFFPTPHLDRRPPNLERVSFSIEHPLILSIMLHLPNIILQKSTSNSQTFTNICRGETYRSMNQISILQHLSE